MLTRRDILKSFLGIPLAISACKSGSPKFEFDGKIVGASNNIGHILREKRNWTLPASVERKTRVAIVGGGIAGLSAAWKLKKEGLEDFLLLELENRIGGTSASGSSDLTNGVFSSEKENGGFQYPWGAHYLPVPFKENTELTSLLQEMDLVDSLNDEDELVIKEEFLTRDPEERLFHQGRWYEGLYLHAGESEEDIRQLARFEKLIAYWTDWRDASGKRAFTVPVSSCSTDAEVTNFDRISFKEWLRLNEFTSDRLIWYCDYACRDDYGLTLEQTSAWAGLFYFCARVPKGGEESQSYVTFPEGNGKFVQHFGKELTPGSRRSTIVVEIIPGETSTRLLCFEPAKKNLFLVEAEKVIFSAPLFTAPFLIRGFRESPPFDAQKFEHNSWFVANLFLKERPKNRFRRDFPLAWDNVLYDSKSLGYVTSTHQKGVDYGPTILTYYYPMATENSREGMTRLLALNWKELADICLTDLERAHPDIRESVQRIDIMRWGHAMIGPKTGFVWSGEREKTIEPFRDIVFAHSDQSGIAIFEEAFYHGIRAAGEIISQTR